MCADLQSRFYTEEGNWDLVGNNVPVSFIQDAIKFPDLVPKKIDYTVWRAAVGRSAHQSENMLTA